MASVARISDPALHVDGAVIDQRWNGAHEKIDGTRTFGSDMIVVGSSGLIGLTRMILGSVARNVLSQTDAWILIVRGPIRAKARRSAQDVRPSAAAEPRCSSR